MSDENPTLPYPDASVEHPTLVIPGGDGPGGPESKPAARRRRWPWVLLSVVIVLGVLIVAAEFIARALLPGVVRGIVIEQLDLPADQQLDVDASGVLIPQLIGGTLDELHLATESVTFGGITGAVDVTASGIPLHGGDLSDAHGTVRIDQEQFTALVANADLPIDEIAFAAPDVTASGSFAVFGIDIPIALTVTPGADAGELLLTPVELEISGVVLNAQQIAERFGNLASGIADAQRICIADQLPAGLTVTDLSIVGTEAVIDISVDGAIVTDETLQRNGVCP